MGYFNHPMPTVKKLFISNSERKNENAFESDEILICLKSICFCMPLLVDFSDIFFDFLYVYKSNNQGDIENLIHTDIRTYMVMSIFGFVGIGKFLIYAYFHIDIQQQNPVLKYGSIEKRYSPEVTKMTSKLAHLMFSFVFEGSVQNLLIIEIS